MNPTSLPTIYDYSDPASNLAGLLPDVLEQNRFLTGVEYIPYLVAAAHGYRRSGGNILTTVLWGLAGYMAPLPVVGFAIYEETTRPRGMGDALSGPSCYWR